MVNKKGFTLIELLIVIAVLAILTAAVVVVLNPAQLLAQARDSQRMSDLDTLKSSIALYLTDVASPSLGAASTCYPSNVSVGATCGGRHFGAITATPTTSRAINGTGWVPVAFSNISAGTPISALPLDPTNSTTYYYSYVPDGGNSTFEIDAKLESNKYAGASNKEGNDGGSSTTLYEVGTDPGLNL